MISLTRLAAPHFTIFQSAAEEVACHRRDRDAFVDDGESIGPNAVTNWQPLKGGLMQTRFYALGNDPVRRII